MKWGGGGEVGGGGGFPPCLEACVCVLGHASQGGSARWYVLPSSLVREYE